MTGTSSSRRSRRRVAGRTGYVITVVVNAVLFYLINDSPGWEQAPFLSPEFEQLVGLVDLALLIAIIVNVLYLVYDPPWFHALGQVVTNGVSAFVAWNLFREFPFSVGDEWGAVIKGLLIVVMAVTLLAAVVSAVKFVGALSRRTAR